MENNDFIRLYQDRLKESQDVYEDKYLRMHYAEQAYRQEIPDDIKEATTNTDDSEANKYLPPILTYVINAYKQELTVNNPQHVIKANNRQGKAVVKEYNDKMGEIFSYHNWGHKSQFAYHIGLVKGTIISETIYKPIQEFMIPADADVNSSQTAIEPLQLGGGVDYVAYDPMLCAPDPDANPQDIRGTMRWCIVTKGFFTSDYIKEVYGVDVVGSGSAGGMSKTNDLNFWKERKKAGMDMYRKKDTHSVRDYYLLDGKVYTILNDEQVVATRWNATGQLGVIPINICPLKPDPHSVFGFTWWDILKNPIAVVARVCNQVLDNNDFSNNFPLLVIAGTAPQLTELENNARKIIEVNPVGEKMDIAQLIQKLTFPEITQGATFVYNIAMQHIQYLTGVTPASQGMQAKQMRVAGEAEMINNAIVSNSSEIVLNMESSYINACIWDTLRIFARYFETFSFKYITKDFLKNYKNIHVANGSTLSSDKVGAQQLAASKMNLIPAYPNLLDAPAIIEEYLRSLGDNTPETSFRTVDQIKNTEPALELASQQRAKAAMQGAQNG